MIFLDLINLKKIRRAVICVLCIIAALWIQIMVLARVDIAGAKPMILPGLAAAFGFWLGGVWGGSLGIVAGLLYDRCCTGSAALYLVLFAAFGFFAGVLAEYLLNRRFLSFFILSAAALVVTALCQIIPMWLFHDAMLGPLLATGAKQTLWSLPLTVPVYFAAKGISKR